MPNVLFYLYINFQQGWKIHRKKRYNQQGERNKKLKNNHHNLFFLMAARQCKNMTCSLSIQTIFNNTDNLGLSNLTNNVTTDRSECAWSPQTLWPRPSERRLAASVSLSGSKCFSFDNYVVRKRGNNKRADNETFALPSELSSMISTCNWMKMIRPSVQHFPHNHNSY